MVDPQVEYSVLMIEGPNEFSRECAEVRLVLGGGQPLFNFGITYVCFINGRLPVFAVGRKHQYVFFVKSIIWRTHINIKKSTYV